MNAWQTIDVAALPLAIRGQHERHGNTIEMAETREQECRWDGVMRPAYRVRTSSGRTTLWTPCSRARTSWEAKLVK